MARAEPDTSAPVPTLGAALFLPRYVLVTIELAATLLTIAAVFGFSKGVLAVTAASLVPMALVLWAQSRLEQRRHVRPTEALARRVASGEASAHERWELGEALVRLPRRLTYVRFMGWTATLATLVVAVSALGDVGWRDLAALGGVCSANALVFLLWRSTWTRAACEQALWPLLRTGDAARYDGRRLRGRLFAATVFPIAAGALVALLYDWLFLELPPGRIRELAALLPALLVLVAGVVAATVVAVTRKTTAYLAGRPRSGATDVPWLPSRPPVDPGARAALVEATSAPAKIASVAGVSWLLAGALLAVRHAWEGAPAGEALLLFGGMASTAVATSLLQFGFARGLLQPARETAARALDEVPFDALGPQLRVRARFVGAVLGITVAAGTFAYATLYLQWRALRASAAEVQARGVLELAWPGIEPLSRYGVGGRIAGLRALDADEAWVLVDAGRVAWSSRPLVVPEEARRELEAGLEAVTLPRTQETLALKAFPNGGAVGVVRHWSELGGAYGFAGLTILFAVIALLAVTVAIYAAEDFTRPVRQLRAFARRLGQGELDAALPVPDPDELGELALTLDRMRRDLKAQVAKVTELNLGLEQKVADRTAALTRALADLQAAQDAVVHAEKMATVGRLGAGVAHEVNNPLNFIANALGPLEATLRDAREVLALAGRGDLAAVEQERKRRDLDGSLAELDDLVRLIRNGVRRTQDIVRGLRDFSRRDENDPPVDADVHALLEETLTFCGHELGTGITVTRAFTDDGRARVFRGPLLQVFTNLVTNAAQAMHGRGTLTLRTRADGDRLVVEVADDGPGIPADVLPKVFEPFFTTKPAGQGTGLGLSIAHSIVERHGGRLRVSSEPGHGTTFTLDLPRPPAA